MTAPAADPVFAALNPLVLSGELSIPQAQALHDQLRPLVPDRPLAPPARRSPTAAPARRIPAVAFGGVAVALVGILMSAGSAGGEFSAKTFFVPLIGSVALLAAAFWLWRTEHSDAGQHWTAAALASAGTLGIVLTLSATSDDAVLSYLCAAALLAVGIGGFARSRSSVFAAVSTIGALWLFLHTYADTNSDGGGLTSILSFGVALMMVGLFVAGAGWAFSCRTVTGLLGAAVAMASMLVVIVVDLALSVVLAAFDSLAGEAGPDIDITGAPGLSSLFDDVRIAMALTVVIAAVVLGAYILDGHTGYIVVAVSGLVVNLALGVGLTAGRHLVLWSSLVLLAGLVGLGVALLLWHRRSPARRWVRLSGAAGRTSAPAGDAVAEPDAGPEGPDTVF